MHPWSFAAQFDISSEVVSRETFARQRHSGLLVQFGRMCSYGRDAGTPITPVAVAVYYVLCREEAPLDLVFPFLLRFGVLQCLVRIGVATPLHGAIRRYHRHGVDCPFRLHGRTGPWFLGE